MFQFKKMFSNQYLLKIECERERENKDKTWDGTKVNIPRKLNQVNHYVNDKGQNDEYSMILWSPDL